MYFFTLENAYIQQDANDILQHTAMSALNILLVDDNPNLVTTLSHGLRKAMGNAISVAVSFSGSEALSMLASHRFDVVISEFNMPGESGLELLEKIRHDHGETIQVLVTTYGTDALEEEVHRLGIGYVTKPFEPSHLVQIIRGEGTKAETENAPRIVIPDPKGNADLGRLMGNVLTD